MKIAITGHRPNKLGNDYDLTSSLILSIKAEILKYVLGYKNREISFNGDYVRDLQLITGMALGIDTLFAEIAIEHNIPFIAAIPCYNQDKLWNQATKDKYSTIINNKLCCLVFVKEGEYDNSCMQKRNEWMVDNCDILIAIWDGSPGGTANCARYAKSQDKPIIYINPKDYETTKKN